MPELVRLYIRHVIIGFAVAVAFTALLLGLNVANLWHLVRATDVGPLAVVMLVVFNTIVFAGVQFGIAVMSLGHEGDPQGGKPNRASVPAAVRVAAESGGNRGNRDGVNFPRA